MARSIVVGKVVFTQDRSGLASPGGGKAEPRGRIEITPDVTEQELRARLRSR